MSGVRYRKVATDKCKGGPLEMKYQAHVVNCPVIKPAGLSIEVTGGDVIPVNRNVIFNLTQEQVVSFLFYLLCLYSLLLRTQEGQASGL